MSKKIEFMLFCLISLLAFVQQAEADINRVGLDLYGHKLFISADFPAISSSNTINKVEIRTDLEKFTQEFDVNLLLDLNRYSEEFAMDDMGFLMMSRKLAAEVYQTEYQRNVFLYHLLKLKQYDVILGFSNNQTTVYGQLGFIVFNVIDVQLGNKTFTDLSFSQKRNPQTEEIFEDQIKVGRAILINENRPPLFNATSKEYKFYFEFEGFIYFFNGILNESIVKYYNDLPDIVFSNIYLNYSFSQLAKNSLMNDLAENILYMSNLKALAFLLKFSQDAIPYKDDYMTLGKEKFSFPEETIANQFADCEDKSILFAYLVKELLHKPSLALIYYQQNHLNVAIESKDKEDYNFSFKDRRYLVCEPSGTGFKPGENTYDVNKASVVNW
jgi:hypothetical protein